MLENGADIRFVQQLLGHARLNTTPIYSEVSIRQLRDVHTRCHPQESRSGDASTGHAEGRTSLPNGTDTTM